MSNPSIPEHREPPLIVEKLQSLSCLFPVVGSEVIISGRSAHALLTYIRRLKTEAFAPYQCYWRDRALKAEAALAGTTAGTQIEEH